MARLKLKDIAAFVDEYGAIAEQLKVLEKRKKELKEVMRPHCSPTKPLMGTNFCIDYTYEVKKQERLNVELIRREMAAVWIEEFTQLCDVETFRIKKINVLEKQT